MAESLRREGPDLRKDAERWVRFRLTSTNALQPPGLSEVKKSVAPHSGRGCFNVAGLTFTVLSSEHDRRNRPSFEKVTQRTVPLCAFMAEDLPSLRETVTQTRSEGAFDARGEQLGCPGGENSHSREPETDRLVF